jgi:hypothetical protein
MYLPESEIELAPDGAEQMLPRRSPWPSTKPGAGSRRPESGCCEQGHPCRTAGIFRPGCDDVTDDGHYHQPSPTARGPRMEHPPAGLSVV